MSGHDRGEPTVRLTAEAFQKRANKRIALIGMSGTGKTTIARKLPADQWFHFSGDYRIGTRYLEEKIIDEVKLAAMQVPYLRQLLIADSITISSNLTVDNLAPLSVYLGKIGNPEKGGLSLKEFKYRQQLHHDAEISAVKDISTFIKRAQQIYDYPHFLADLGGSLCELTDPSAVETVAEHCVILYLKTDEKHERLLIDRAQKSPKPLYYPSDFLDLKLAQYMELKNIPFVALVDPDDFVRWVFPKLFYARMPKYQQIADQYGYSVSADDFATLRDEQDFLQLTLKALS